MGNVIGQDQQHQPQQEMLGSGSGSKGSTTYLTVQLNVSYKNAIRTPGTVMARSWIVKREGRKVWVRGVVEGEGGLVHAEAEGIWVQIRAKM
jgi:acyl-CoA thioesterase FadM